MFSTIQPVMTMAACDIVIEHLKTHSQPIQAQDLYHYGRQVQAFLNILHSEALISLSSNGGIYSCHSYEQGQDVWIWGPEDGWEHIPIEPEERDPWEHHLLNC